MIAFCVGGILVFVGTVIYCENFDNRGKGDGFWAYFAMSIQLVGLVIARFL